MSLPCLMESSPGAVNAIAEVVVGVAETLLSTTAGRAESVAIASLFSWSFELPPPRPSSSWSSLTELMSLPCLMESSPDAVNAIVEVVVGVAETLLSMTAGRAESVAIASLFSWSCELPPRPSSSWSSLSKLTSLSCLMESSPDAVNAIAEVLVGVTETLLSKTVGRAEPLWPSWL